MKAHEAYLLVTANALFLETAHVYTTCLSEGKELTPPTMATAVGAVHGMAGEASYNLE